MYDDRYEDMPAKKAAKEKERARKAIADLIADTTKLREGAFKHLLKREQKLMYKHFRNMDSDTDGDVLDVYLNGRQHWTKTIFTDIQKFRKKYPF